MKSISAYYEGSVFNTINGLEETVQDIDRLAHGLMLPAAGMESPEWRPIWTIAKIIKDRAGEVEDARERIFDLTHPAAKGWKDKGGLEAYRDQFTSKTVA